MRACVNARNAASWPWRHTRFSVLLVCNSHRRRITRNRGKAVVDPEMARFHDIDFLHDKGYRYLFFTSEKVMIVENDVDGGEGSNLEG